MQKVVASKRVSETQLVETKPTTEQEEKFQALVTQNEKEYSASTKNELNQENTASEQETQQKAFKIHSENEQSNSEKQQPQILQIDPSLFQQLIDGQISLADIFVLQKVKVTPDLIEKLKQLISSSDVPSQDGSKSRIEDLYTDEVEMIAGELPERKVVSAKDSSLSFDSKVIVINAAPKDVLESDGIIGKVDQPKETKPVGAVDVAKLPLEQQESLKKQITDFLRARSPDETKSVQVNEQTESKENSQVSDKKIAMINEPAVLVETNEEPQVRKKGHIQTQHFEAQTERPEKFFAVSSKVVIGDKTPSVVQKQQVERLDLSGIVLDKEFSSVGSKVTSSIQISGGQKVETMAKPLEQAVKDLQKAVLPVVEKTLMSNKSNATRIVFNLKPTNLGEMRVLVKTDQQSVNLEFEVQDSTVRDMLQKLTHKLDRIMENLQFETSVKTVKQFEASRQTVENAELFGEQQDATANEFMQGEQAQQRKFTRARKLRTQVPPDDQLSVEDRSGPGTISMLV